MIQQTLNDKDALLSTWEREHATTMKLLRNLPEGKEDFRPAPKSKTTRELVWTFVMEERLALKALTTGFELKGQAPTIPQGTVRELVDMYDQAYRETLDRLRSASEADFSKTTKFFTGPGKLDDFRVGQLLWMFLSDTIHHRGQLSVYLRMLDARVPAIYGPSADEPWT